MIEGSPQEQPPHAVSQQPVEQYPPFDPARSANAGEAALAEVESAGSHFDDFFDREAGTWRHYAPVKGGLLAKRQELRNELQGLEPGAKRYRLRKEIRELNRRIDRRTKGALDEEALTVAFHNSDQAFGRAVVPDAQVSTTDEIEANGGQRLDNSHIYPERQDFIAAELDEKLEGGAKAGYYEFAHKLNQLYDVLSAQREANKEMLASLHNIEAAIQAIPPFDEQMEYIRQMTDQQLTEMLAAKSVKTEQ